jgi:glutathione synthase/RimK-type ligase-like ATP-grasp enzyme
MAPEIGTKLYIAANTENPTVIRLSESLPAVLMLSDFDAKEVPTVRWGSLYRITNAGATLNRQKSIKRAVNKLESVKIMREKSVPVPSEVTNPPCVGKAEYTTRGEGVFFCTNESEMQSARDNGALTFYEWIDINTEYRVHIFGDEVLFISKKKRSFLGHSDPHIHSISLGWRFVDNPKIDAADAIELISAALGAVKALRLDFGAVDIALTHNNRPVVFEVNTAPGLNQENCMKYTTAINKWLESTR